MRRRLVISTIAVVLVVLGALAVPVGLTVYESAARQLDTRLEQQAASIAATYSRDVAAGEQPDLVTLRDALGPDDGLQIIGPTGEMVFRVSLDATGSTREVTRMLPDGSKVTVMTSVLPLDQNFRDQLTILLVLAAGALAAAAGLAAVQAHQLARPLERLARPCRPDR